jgi:hypothetical protein
MGENGIFHGSMARLSELTASVSEFGSRVAKPLNNTFENSRLPPLSNSKTTNPNLMHE